MNIVLKMQKKKASLLNKSLVKVDSYQRKSVV